jgi:flavin-binding protein dodecin
MTRTVRGSEQSSRGVTMSVYKIIEVVGTSSASWEDAAVQAVNTAKETLRDLRVAEVVEQDLDLTGDEVVFRTKLSISFKYQAD